MITFITKHVISKRDAENPFLLEKLTQIHQEHLLEEKTLQTNFCQSKNLNKLKQQTKRNKNYGKYQQKFFENKILRITDSPALS